MRWQHLLHAKCFKVGILPFKTSLYFFLWKFQMQCFLFFSSLEHPPPCACEFLFFSSFFTFFFFGSTTSFIFSISCCPLFSITWEKRSKLYGETWNGRSKSEKRKNAKSNKVTQEEGGSTIFFNALIGTVKTVDGFQTRVVQPRFERFHAFYV